jgi:cellulose synthase/poly-beta-1,6-N-acetylglucosamine synthase-like glycosyltransferase
MKLKDFGLVVRTTGIIYLLLLSANDVVYIPLSVVILITIGYLSTAISCKEKLLSPSFEHHKLVSYFIAFLGVIIITKHYTSVFL